MSDSSNECCRAAERFCFRAFLVSFGFMLVWFLAMIFADEFIIGLHAKFLGITGNNMLQFKYDARMTMYLLMGMFKLAAMLLFFIPWLVLRFGRCPKAAD
jgi:hypothetical protein